MIIIKVFSKNNWNYAVYLKCLVLPSDRKFCSIHSLSFALLKFSLISLLFWLHRKKLCFRNSCFHCFPLFIIYYTLYIQSLFRRREKQNKTKNSSYDDILWYSTGIHDFQDFQSLFVLLAQDALTLRLIPLNFFITFLQNIIKSRINL